ncbi:MAG: hypothetical protein AAB368_09920, partial [bacterium]
MSGKKTTRRGDWLDQWRAATPVVKARWLKELERLHGHAREKPSRVVTDTIRRSFRRMSANRKLAWLEEANRFLQKAAPPRTKRLH